MHIDGGQQTGDGGDGIVVASGKVAGDCGETECRGIKALAGSRNRGLTDIRAAARRRTE